MKNDMKDSASVGNGQFGSKIGFILASVGSAVGMGNIWLFPYRVGQYGGAAFLIPYFLFVALFGMVGLSGEFAFGRLTGTGPIGSYDYAMKTRGKKGGSILGAIPLFGSLGIAIGYAIIVGWVLRFAVGSATGAMFQFEPSEYFGQITGAFGSFPWHIVVILVTIVSLTVGIIKGIEKVNKFMMPAFFCLFLILAIRVGLLSGAKEGFHYLFYPDWSLMSDPKTWVFALGQAFFSLSLAGSGTIVYGSYLKDTEDIIGCARNVAIFDTIASILAGFVIIPAVFAFGLDPAAGPPLMFITMPKVFQMMPLGQFFAILFFVAVLFAAITSLMNLFETPIEALQEKFGFSRKLSVCVIAFVSAVIGVLIESGDSVGKWMDVVSIYIIPLGALLAGIMFFWICGDRFAREQAQMGRQKTLGKWFLPMTKYLFVGLTFIVYILGIFYGGIG